MKSKVKLPKKGIKRESLRKFLFIAVPLLLILGLYTYKLGGLTHGLSAQEATVSHTPVGWSGLYQNPLFAPLKLVRSVVFFLEPNYGQALLRISNVFFGMIAIAAFYLVVRSWHGAKITIMTTLLFICSAFTLHVSRLASNDVMYFMALPLLFFAYHHLRKHHASKLALLFSVLVWLTLLFTPGLVWIVLISLYTQQDSLGKSIKSIGTMWKTLFSTLVVSCVGLLGYLLYVNSLFITWLGLPEHMVMPLKLLRQFVGVFVHLFTRGPQYPELWLGKLPILDIFCWSMCIIGIYFYAKHARAARTRAMFLYASVGIILVALGGSVSLALLVPLLYLLLATGITYIRQEWLHVFPSNPIARTFGTGMVLAAVLLSCTYNLRSYFVAWPHNSATRSTFSHRK